MESRPVSHSTMLHHPDNDRVRLLALLPLSLLLGGLTGLAFGALSSQIEALRVLGPELGRLATIGGAVLGTCIAAGALSRARSRALGETGFQVGPESLSVTWPGFALEIPWDQVESVAQRNRDLVLTVAGRGPLVLFGLRDPDQLDRMIRGRRRPQPAGPERERAA